MSILSNQPGGVPKRLQFPYTLAQTSRFLPLFWMTIILLSATTVFMHLYHLNVPFDRDGYDEGVYWQSLRAMQAGYSLYKTIFYSQPPAFLLSIFPGYALFGTTLWSARFSVMLVSLLALPGALLLGKTLAGRLGLLTALLLLLVNPFFLAESQTIQAEAPSVAFTFLAIGFAFLWWHDPDGWRGSCWAALTGVTLAVSILCKLLCVSTLVPIAFLMGSRIWQFRTAREGVNSRSWLPLLVGIASAILTILALTLPFAGAWQAFWNSVVTFHEVAGKKAITTQPPTIRGNLHLMEPALLSPLTLAALYGALTAFLRRDWRVLPLLAWLVITFALLLFYHPLFSHHLIALEPPLIALTVLGVARSRAYEASLAKVTILNGDDLQKFAPLIPLLTLLLVVFTAAFSFLQDTQYYNAVDATRMSALVQQDLRAANDLRHTLSPEQWVVTDGQFIAGLADRNTPPSLVDTSGVRFQSGYVTLAQLEQSATDPRVHAVLFYTARFSDNARGFHAWVALHFHLFRVYGPGQELWIR